MGTQIATVRKPARLEGADLARLAAKAPAKADTEVESRAQQLGAKLRIERRWMFPTAKNGESLPSYQIVTAVSVAIASDANRLAVLEMIEKSMTPATAPMVEAWLAELSEEVIVPAGRSELRDELRLSTALGAHEGQSQPNAHAEPRKVVTDGARLAAPGHGIKEVSASAASVSVALSTSDAGCLMRHADTRSPGRRLALQ
jgi:hypothetical protein